MAGKNRNGRAAWVVVAAIGALAVGLLAGGALVGVFFGGGGAGLPAVQQAADDRAALDYATSATSGPASPEEGAAKDAATSQPGQMIVRTGSMDLRVDDIDASVAKVRAIAARAGAEISDFYSYAGDPAPLEAARAGTEGPASATITLRVAAAKLEQTREAVSAIGEVVSENASASDVTQQYVDMDARLKNLKAEEARLRELLDRTNKVSELLAVESELSRVRGEIESLQAQLEYLATQVEKATLVVSMSEPAPVVPSSGIDWGVREAVARGVRGAAIVVQLLITAALALAPVGLILALVWFVVRAIMRRRTVKAKAVEQTVSDDAIDEDQA